MTTDALDAPALESALSECAGCVADPEQASAGCASPTGDESPADAPPPAASDGAGCAAQAPADASEGKATPPQTLRELQRALQGLGYSRFEASAIASKGYPGLTAAAAPEADDGEIEIESLRQALERRASALKGNYRE